MCLRDSAYQGKVDVLLRTCCTFGSFALKVPYLIAPRVNLQRKTLPEPGAAPVRASGLTWLMRVRRRQRWRCGAVCVQECNQQRETADAPSHDRISFNQDDLVKRIALVQRSQWRHRPSTHRSSPGSR